MKQSAAKSSTATAPKSSGGAAQHQPFFGGREGAAPVSDVENQFFAPAAALGIQAKLTIGAPDDPLEREADAVADQVVQRLAENPSAVEPPAAVAQNLEAKPIQRLPISTIQRKCDHCEQEEKMGKGEEEEQLVQEKIQRKPIFESAGDSPPDDDAPNLQRKISDGGSGGWGVLQMKCADCAAEEQESVLQKKDAGGGGEATASADVSSRLSASKGGGSPLPADLGASMGGAMGADFSGVRVHTDSGAAGLNRDLGARAFTYGSDVYFGAGEFAPSSSGGRRLLAHELVHTVQQSRDSIHKKTAGSENLNILKEQLDRVLTYAGTCIYQIQTCQDIGTEAIEAYKNRLITLQANYKEAYNNHTEILKKATEEAETEQAWKDFIIGIGIGVGFVLEFVAAAEAVAHIYTLTARLSRAAKGVPANAKSEAFEGALSWALPFGGGNPKIEANKELDPSLMEIGIWKKAYNLQVAVTKLNAGLSEVSRIQGIANRLLGRIEGGKITAEDKYNSKEIITDGEFINELNNSLLKASERFERMKNSSSKIGAGYSVQKMERDIWIFWLSSLELDSNLIDYDAIEDRLGSVGVLGALGMDFGVYTSDAEENLTIERAKYAVGLLCKIYQQSLELFTTEDMPTLPLMDSNVDATNLDEGYSGVKSVEPDALSVAKKVIVYNIPSKSICN